MSSFRSSISLSVKTRLVSAKQLTERFGVDPYAYVEKGDSVRRFSSGKAIQVARQQWTTWTCVFELNESEIEEKVNDIAVICVDQKDLVGEIVSGGGWVQIQIRLDGARNTGDDIGSGTLETIGKMGIGLSIEVFP